MSTQNAKQELDEWVADAVREGFTVDSRVGDRAFISRKVGISGLAVFVYIVLIIVLFPIGLLFIIPWVNASKRTLRFEIFIDPSGEIVQTQLGKTETQIAADRRMGRNLAVAGLAAFLLGVFVNVLFDVTLGNIPAIGGLAVAAFGAWKLLTARR